MFDQPPPTWTGVRRGENDSPRLPADHSSLRPNQEGRTLMFCGFLQSRCGVSGHRQELGDKAWITRKSRTVPAQRRPPDIDRGASLNFISRTNTSGLQVSRGSGPPFQSSQYKQHRPSTDLHRTCSTTSITRTASSLPESKPETSRAIPSSSDGRAAKTGGQAATYTTIPGSPLSW